MTCPSLRDWATPSGVLADYEHYWLPTSDAPRIYQIACGLMVIASCLESRVYLQHGGDRIYPNLWILILGPSSFYRKSSTISKAKRTISKLHVGGPGALLPDEFSREALVRRLSERSQGVLTSSEFASVLALFSRDYMSGTQQMLAELYDCPSSYQRVVGSQTLTLQDVWLSILAASQTDWFLEKIKHNDLRGGFLARFTYWPAFEKARFIAIPPEPDHARGARLLQDLNALRKLEGPATLDEGATKIYTRWIERHERELHNNPRIGELSPFWSRLSIVTLKLAIILQAAHDRERIITAETINQAIGLSEFLKAALIHLFDEQLAFTKPMQERQKLLRLIRSRPGIARRDLLRASNLLVRDFEPVLSTLRQEEAIELRDGGYWPLDSSASPQSVSESTTDAPEPAFMGAK